MHGSFNWNLICGFLVVKLYDLAFFNSFRNNPYFFLKCEFLKIFIVKVFLVVFFQVAFSTEQLEIADLV